MYELRLIGNDNSVEKFCTLEECKLAFESAIEEFTSEYPELELDYSEDYAECGDIEFYQYIGVFKVPTTLKEKMENEIRLARIGLHDYLWNLDDSYSCESHLFALEKLLKGGEF